MNKICLNQRTWVRCGWLQYSLLHCKYESQDPVFTPHCLLVLLYNFYFRWSKNGMQQFSNHNGESKFIDTEYIGKMSCSFLTCYFHYQVKEICCGAEIDPKQVRQNHLIVNTCEYTMQKNCVCLQISLHWVLSWRWGWSNFTDMNEWMPRK